MKVTFLSVGYGEAIVIQKENFTMLIDGGSLRDECYTASGTIRLFDYLRAQNISKIDCIIMTHLHDDHICGLLPVIEALPVGGIWCNVLPQGPIRPMLDRIAPYRAENLSRDLFWRALDCYDHICAIAKARNIPMQEMTGDGSIHAIGGIKVQPFGMHLAHQNDIRRAFESMFANEDLTSLLAQFSENDFICNSTSLAFLLQDGEGRVLLTGDKVSGWDMLCEQYDLRANVLKGTHHGQIDGLPQILLESVSPDAVVFCADSARTWNSADPSVLSRASNYLTHKGKEPLVYVTGYLSNDIPNASSLSFTLGPSRMLSKTDITIC